MTSPPSTLAQLDRLRAIADNLHHASVRSRRLAMLMAFWLIVVGWTWWHRPDGTLAPWLLGASVAIVVCLLLCIWFAWHSERESRKARLELQAFIRWLVVNAPKVKRAR